MWYDGSLSHSCSGRPTGQPPKLTTDPTVVATHLSRLKRTAFTSVRKLSSPIQRFWWSSHIMTCTQQSKHAIRAFGRVHQRRCMYVIKTLVEPALPSQTRQGGQSKAKQPRHGSGGSRRPRRVAESQTCPATSTHPSPLQKALIRGWNRLCSKYTKKSGVKPLRWESVGSGHRPQAQGCCSETAFPRCRCRHWRNLRKTCLHEKPIKFIHHQCQCCAKHKNKQRAHLGERSLCKARSCKCESLNQFQPKSSLHNKLTEKHT